MSVISDLSTKTLSKSAERKEKRLLRSLRCAHPQREREREREREDGKKALPYLDANVEYYGDKKNDSKSNTMIK